MDINDLKKIIEKEKAKVIIVENGKPILIVSPFEDDKQQKLEFSEKREREIMEIQEEKEKGDQKFQMTETKEQDRTELMKKEREEVSQSTEEVSQSTEVISKEEMPLEELRVEDLPF